MLEALKSLFENNVISEEIKADIETAWESRINENREQVTAVLREEFAQRYEHDKKVMVEAVEQMISDRLRSEIEEFSEDRKSLAEAKARYAVALREHSDTLKGFIMESLVKEISELHSDQKLMAENFSKLEDFIITALSKEIAEFYTDKRELAETKVKLVREAKSEFAKIKRNFVKQSAGLVEGIVTKGLSKEINQLKEDIDQARENDFGRRIFEAFTTEYQHSLLNERSETSKLLKVIAKKDQQIAEANNVVRKAKTLIENKEQEIARVRDMSERKEIMNELLAPLSKGQRSVMNELLESVQTTKLRGSYDKYLPAVLSGSKPERKQALVEGKIITGNKQPNSISGATSQGEVIDIRRLAGLN